jgi:2-keto-3-deoxy-L-rhamnonate aldolase RhmA
MSNPVLIPNPVMDRMKANVETVGHMAQVALGCGVAPMVRVRSVDDPNVSLYLDNGVTGIIFPDVNTAAEAQRGVDAAKFAPIGKRSVCGGYPHFDYRAVPLTQSVPALNDAAMVVCMIETVEGLNNVEAIAAVKGVDAGARHRRRQGCLFVTTQTDIGFLTAAASQWTSGVRKALIKPE